MFSPLTRQKADDRTGFMRIHGVTDQNCCRYDTDQDDRKKQTMIEFFGHSSSLHKRDRHGKNGNQKHKGQKNKGK
jgi:hypothetical protein